MAKTTSKRPSRGGRGGPSGIVAWTLWLIVIALLAVIARYAYIAAQPDRTGYTLFGREASLMQAGKLGLGGDEGAHAGKASRKALRDYSKSDKAKLNQLVGEASSARP